METLEIIRQFRTLSPAERHQVLTSAFWLATYARLLKRRAADPAACESELALVTQALGDTPAAQPLR